MIKSLTLKNVGAMPEKTINFGKRLNIITGDNGLGKSFLLDIIWFVLTKHWPGDINGKMTSGYMARPNDVTKEASISAISLYNDDKTTATITANYQRLYEQWEGKYLMPMELVLYAHYDGSFSVWDPERNFWSRKTNDNLQERQPAFVLTPDEVWNGFEIEQKETGKMIPICNGLVRDWVSWQDRNSDEFGILTNVLKRLSPPDIPILPKQHERISTRDSREHPVVQMPYGAIPVVWTSAGIRRILALAYMMAWTLTEHLKTCKVLGRKPASRMTFLFDEVDSHLHPKWQRQIMNGIMGVLEGFANIAEGNDFEQLKFFSSLSEHVQIISVTHSPLVMASVESFFNPDYDKWLDLDFSEKGEIVLTERSFERLGNSEDWLISEAFDLKSTYSVEAEKAMSEASKLLEEGKPLDLDAIKKAYQKLLKTLNPKDSFLLRFRYICEKKGVKLS